MKRWLFQNGNVDFVPSHATLCPCFGVRGGGGFHVGHCELAGHWKHQRPSPWILSRQKDGPLFSPGEQAPCHLAGTAQGPGTMGRGQGGWGGWEDACLCITQHSHPTLLKVVLTHLLEDKREGRAGLGTLPPCFSLFPPLMGLLQGGMNPHSHQTAARDRVSHDLPQRTGSVSKTPKGTDSKSGVRNEPQTSCKSWTCHKFQFFG